MASYRSSLKRFADLEPDAIFKEANFGDFLSFIVTNQWHYKKAFGFSRDPIVEISDVMKIQRLGDIFVSEYRKNKLCTIASTKENLNKLIFEVIKKIDDKPDTK
ncbi:hypothetical protein DA70_11800 [Pandoraea pnomenusa]|uniref:hypothetical protein n=1 Tax=Pandoraea pnomenusa TaxID=93220 RepID=UPI000437555D|nr:hypothetical protein [Pandoraea pnomenusa]AHN77460.1 hypothetical protein DA70_11800 [Pandoraea pnomenusa]